MRLLHTLSLKLEEFFDNNIPPYAILSHRWEKGEVSLQDLVSGRGRWKQGYAKIQSCCDRASRDGLEYVWIDTCCIDKSSSAELSEAINSMFQWYRSAFICYAYLSDVTAGFEVGASFRLSQWFTRGWTLQELLAPDWVLFFDKDWKDLGTKSSLSSLISSITGINHLLNFKEASVAQKMSWAAKRETTRVEDQAYSLMGLFDVNMPTIYGEGKRAFIRLQLEIIKNSSDESIFAWSQSPRISRLSYHSSMLAPSPSYFRRSSLVKICSIDNQHSPNTMTNMGLRIERLTFQLPNTGLSPDNPIGIIVPLNCMEETDGSILAIRLNKSGQESGYYRETHELLTIKEEWLQGNRALMSQRVLFVPHHDENRETESDRSIELHSVIIVETQPLLTAGFTQSSDAVLAQGIKWNLDDPVRPLLLNNPSVDWVAASLDFDGKGGFHGSKELRIRLTFGYHGGRLFVGIQDKDIWSEAFDGFYKPLNPSDRAYKVLSNGISIAASTRKKITHHSPNTYIVYIELTQQGLLPWNVNSNSIIEGQDLEMETLEPRAFVPEWTCEDYRLYGA